MTENDNDQHNTCEMETGLPRHAVAKNTCSELQKPCVGDETYSNENKPWDDHYRSCRNQKEISSREAGWACQTSNISVVGFVGWLHPVALSCEVLTQEG